MAFSKIKNRFLKHKLTRDLALQPSSRTIDEKKIHTVGIITTDDFSSSLPIVEKLNSRIHCIRNIHMLSYREYDPNEEKSYKHFTSKDINWQGKINNASLANFIDTPFDLLIGLFDEKQVYLEYAVLKSEATFKVGVGKVNDALFDMVINENRNQIDSYIQEVYKYAKILNKV